MDIWEMLGKATENSNKYSATWTGQCSAESRQDMHVESLQKTKESFEQLDNKSWNWLTW